MEGMIESAAADSSSGHTLQATPSSSSPSSSSDDHLSDSPPTKQRRLTSDLDDTAGFMFPESGRRGKNLVNYSWCPPYFPQPQVPVV